MNPSLFHGFYLFQILCNNTSDRFRFRVNSFRRFHDGSSQGKKKRHLFLIYYPLSVRSVHETIGETVGSDWLETFCSDSTGLSEVKVS